MKAILDIRRYISTHANTESAEVLARIPDTLTREGNLSLADLYALDWESFELAIELLRDWRIDRYYADQTDLFAPPAAPAVAAPTQEIIRLEDLEPAE